MLEFSDLPYEFLPPKPNRLIISLTRIVNQILALPRKNHLITNIDLKGLAEFAKVKKEEGSRFIILPNHPTHSDPQVMNEVCRRMDVQPAFMAAYDVFARNKFASWVMQRTGAFSVDREGSDRKAMKCAAEVLESGEYPLVIFPEGNVYFCNDRVTPFAEGAAYIALRAQLKLGTAAPVYAVPVSLKYTFVNDVREKVLTNLDSIAKKVGTSLSREKPIIEEITRISITTLSQFLLEHGHTPPESELIVDKQINFAAEQIITRLEQKIELLPDHKKPLISRIRKIRSKIHAIRIDPKREEDHQMAGQLADEAMLTLRVLGYSGGYATENPTLDRIAETIARLREDIFSEHVLPVGSREVFARISKPINLRNRIDLSEKISRSTIADLTSEFENCVQEGINQSNKENNRPGRTPF